MVKEYVEKYIARPQHLMNLTIELTSLCNLKCCHCYVDDRSCGNCCDIQSFDNIKKAVDEALSLNAITITLTGGEPMLHPDFSDILQYIKNKGFIVFLKTNGTAISEQNVAVIKQCVQGVILSRYGFSPLTYEAVTGVGGSYEKYENAISLLKKYEVPFHENAILLRENEADLDLFIESKMKIEQYISIHKGNEYAAKHRPSDEALKKYYTHLLSQNEQLLENAFTDEKLVCNCGICSITICANGDLCPCTNFSYRLGNISTNSLNEVWNSEKISVIKEKCKFSYFEKCRRCSMKKYLVLMAPCNNFTETGDINDVSEEMCRHCRIVSEVYNEMFT